MAARTVVEIGDVKVYIRRFEPLKGLRILTDLQKKFLGPLLTAIEMRASNIGMAHPDASKALATLSASLDSASLDQILKLLVDPEYVTLEYGNDRQDKANESTMNMAFEEQGPEAIIQLALEVFKANFQGFWNRAASLIGSAQASEDQATQIQSGT